MSRKIKALMVLKGVKAVDIARQLHLSPVTVNVVLNGYGKSRKVQKAIADALQVEFDELWNTEPHRAGNELKEREDSK